MLFVVVMALGMQLVGETVALRTGEWAYNAAMPIIPGLGVGLTPALQMPLLILPTLWLAHRVAVFRSKSSSVSVPAERRGRKQAKFL